MTSHNVEKALHHLQTAMALLKGHDISLKSRDKPTRKHEWFRETGHLSDKGIEHLYSLFDQGKTVYAAKKEMDLSYRATALRHEQWLKRKAKS
jgi:hypothetical protein